MAAGLQIFDASGNIILDATYRVMRIIGSVYINGDNNSRSDSRLAQGGRDCSQLLNQRWHSVMELSAEK
jgi:hypothetical protein